VIFVGDDIIYIGLDASFDNVEDWEGMQEKAVEANSTTAYITDHEVSYSIFCWYYSGFL
jgi:hypothetical protein